jgi:hypothetical protein
MATLELTKQASDFYTITVTADIDVMQYVRSRKTLHPETDDVTLLLVYGDKNRYSWEDGNIYETLRMIAKDVLTDDELESIDPDALDELNDTLFEGLEELIPYYVGDITITKDGNEYKLHVTEDDIRNIFLSNV